MNTREKIIYNCIYSQFIEPVLEKKLESEILQDELRSQAFDITPQNVSVTVQNRLHLLRSVYPELRQCLTTLKIDSDRNGVIATLWDLWLPLAMRLAERHQHQGRPVIQGLLGSQGTGKTTLGIILTLILKHLGLRCLSISLDDIYKTHADRMRLRETDQRLIWRGPPGTHDIELGIEILEQLKQRRSPVLIPRFDKSLHQGSGDRIAPEPVEGAEVILFEGWFVGVRTIPVQAFNTPPPPIVTEQDRDFAIAMNAKLYDYLPLWDCLDSLIVLHIKDYKLSQQWRLQTEQKMASMGKSAMSDAEIVQFVEYFWRSLHPQLFIPSILQNSQLVDLAIEIDADHLPGKVYKV